LRFVDLATGFRELADLDLVSVTLSRSDVNAERRIGDVLVVELDTHAIFA
jgi:hypothetical protein